MVQQTTRNNINLYHLIFILFSLLVLALANEEATNDTNIFQNHKQDYNQVINHLKNIISEKISEIPKAFGKNKTQQNETQSNNNGQDEIVISEVFASNDVKNVTERVENQTESGKEVNQSGIRILNVNNEKAPQIIIPIIVPKERNMTREQNQTNATTSSPETDGQNKSQTEGNQTETCDITVSVKNQIETEPSTQTDITKNQTETTTQNQPDLTLVNKRKNSTITEKVKNKISKIIPMLAPLLGRKKGNLTSPENVYRLPRNVIPEHYHLNVITYLDESMNFAFSGQVAIAVKCTQATDEIILHALELEIDEKNVEVLEIYTERSSRRAGKFENINNNDTLINSENLVSRSSYVATKNGSIQNDFYKIVLTKELKQDRKYVVMIKFKGYLKETLFGYYRCSYKTEEGKKQWLSVTQFEPTDARKAFPCFDEPDLKATFDINLLHKKEYKAISNAPATSISPMQDNPDWLWTNFTTTPRMSTYLVFFMVSDFEYRTVKQNDFEFEVYARPNAINQTSFALRESPGILQELTQYLYTPYALQKWPIKLIAVPEFSAGAMENWGAVTFRESLLLYDDQSSDTKSRYSITSVIAHELTHQWLGNLVTLKWWNDLWLNEGVTTYVTGLIVEKTHPEWNSLLENTAKMVTNLLEIDSLKGSHQVSVKIDNPNDIGQIFDSISYSKGSMILRMLDLILSDNIFRLGLKSYLSEYAYSNAEKDDLWKHISMSNKKEHLDKNSTAASYDNYKILNTDDGVKTIMDSWTLQTGYPLISVKRDYDKDTAYITQERYLMDRVQSNNYSNITRRDVASKQCWFVPLSYTTEGELDFENTKPKKWLSCSQSNKMYRRVMRMHQNETDNDKNVTEGVVLQRLPSKEQWVIFNIQMAGLYRVNYDQYNWEKIIATLLTPDYNKIHILNRVQLIDDSLDLAWTGDQNYSIALKLVSYLKHETEFIPWTCGLKNLGKLKRALIHGSDFHLFEKYIAQFIAPMYERLEGLNDLTKLKLEEKVENSTDKSRPEDRVKHQVLISSWACRYAVSDCRERAVKYFDDFAEAHKSRSDKGFDVIPADLVSIIYCTAVRYADEIRNHNMRRSHHHPLVRTYSPSDEYDQNGNTDETTEINLNATEGTVAPPAKNEDVFEFLWQMGENENLAQTQSVAILKGLACTTDETKAIRYLNASLEPNSFIRRQDAHVAFAGVASNSKTYMIARNFLYERIKDIHEHLGSKSNKLASYIDSVASQIMTEKDYDELLEFTKQNDKYLSHSQLGIKKSLESAKIMLQWQRNHYDEVIKLLQEYTK